MYDALATNHGHHATTRSEIALLCEGDHLLGERAHALCFGLSRGDATMLEELACEIRKNHLLVSRTASEARTFSWSWHLSLSLVLLVFDDDRRNFSGVVIEIRVIVICDNQRTIESGRTIFQCKTH